MDKYTTSISHYECDNELLTIFFEDGVEIKRPFEWFVVAFGGDNRDFAHYALRYSPSVCKGKMMNALHLVEFKYQDARGLPVSQWVTPEVKEQMEMSEAGYHYQLESRKRA